jgi:hypothetical protein
LVSADLRTGGDGNDRGSVIEVRNRGRLETRVTTRSFIKRWLQDDAFWGGKQLAASYRNMDFPTERTARRLQGKVVEVVAAPQGFLARVGLIDTSSSIPMFFEDVVLSWRAEAAHPWSIVAKVSDMSDANPSQRMPKVGGTIYLVGDEAIYRFEGRTLKLRQVAELPQKAAWYVRRLVGRRALLSYPNSRANELPYLVYSFGSGHVSQPSREEVERFGVSLPPYDLDLDLPRADARPDEELRLPHPLRYDSTEAEWDGWIRIAGDSSRSDEARILAYNELMDLVTPWGHGAWTLDAIRSARLGLGSRSSLVRAGAVRAARAWIWNYPEQVLKWTREERKELENLLADPRFQSEVYQGALRHPEQEMAAGEGRQVSATPTRGRVDLVSIMACSYDVAVAICGSDKAFSLLTSRVPSNPSSSNGFQVKNLGYLHDPRVRPYLYSMILRYFDRTSSHLSFQGSMQLGPAIDALARLGELRFEPLAPLLRDQRLEWQGRSSLMWELARFADQRLVARIIDIAGDWSLPKEYRVSALYSLARCPNDLGKPFVVATSQNAKSDLRSAAEMVLQAWDSMRPGPTGIRRPVPDP